MASGPLISVLMPTYNGEAFLRPQIDSILSQTEQDFELVVIDDGSGDQSNAIVDDYAGRDGRVRRLPSTGNLGQKLRLAELIRAAKGEFICIADQDDVWDAERNARLLAAVAGRPMAFGRSELIEAEGRSLGATVLSTLGTTPDVTRPLTAIFVPMVSAHAAIARRDWLSETALFTPVLPFDWIWAIEASLSGGLAYADDAVVFHRIHGANQWNGGLAGRQSQPLGSRVRAAFEAKLPERLEFWLLLDHLGRSAAIDERLRGELRHLAQTCHHAWFSRWRKLVVGDRALREAIEALFRPLAGSDADWAFFAGRIEVMTRGGFSLANLAEGLRRI